MTRSALPTFALSLLLALGAANVLPAVEPTAGTPPDRWTLADGGAIGWPVAADARLPHGDFIEQGGLRAGQVVTYRVDERRHLTLERTVVWPGLRMIPNNTHGSLLHRFQQEAEPVVTVDGTRWDGAQVERVVLDGTLTIQAADAQGLRLTRCTFPSPTKRVALDRWTLRNGGTRPRTVAIGSVAVTSNLPGPHGLNWMDAACAGVPSTTVAPGQDLEVTVLLRAWLDGETPDAVDPTAEEAARRALVAGLHQDLRLETPVPEIDRAFAFAKVRVAEAINATRGGMMLAPGGLRYYAAVWCNDNVEYAGPFFPFLGNANGVQASLDTYRIYRPYMKADFGKIPSSIIAEGTGTWQGAGDRGDAAMYAYGCSRFCLALGDEAVARELWPAITWTLEFCRRQLNPAGVVASDCDELENRLPAGKANLSTSCLYYGGLRAAADLARSLGEPAQAATYDQQAEALAGAIERYFGSTVEGFPTYRYYDGNTVLRSWICLPLCMGLDTRREGTVAALFSPRLWTVDGLASQSGDRMFWDRSTLYGFRGVAQAGAVDTALPFLQAYTRRRLLGDHVPYPVEAWPEGGQRHLSSESALFCRIFTEGFFGILPTGLHRFRCTPRLPAAWPRMALRSLKAFGRTWDLEVEREERTLRVTVRSQGGKVLEYHVAPGAAIDVDLP